ncbi:MAG: ribulose-phosphate 3-epimerase [Nanoarchaeota archaeon]
MNYQIIPSIIAHNQEELDMRLGKVKSFANFIQLDVMDGKFVADKTFNFPFALPKKLSFEAHLMIKNPFDWIKKNEKFFNSFIVHAETLGFSLIGNPLARTVKELHSKNKSLGIAVNPETPVKRIRKHLDYVDKVLFMTVNPGAYGGKFIVEVLPKIEELRRLMPKLDIEVDGGMNPNTLNLCRKSGANSFVVGSFLQNSPDVKRDWKELQGIIR